MIRKLLSLGIKAEVLQLTFVAGAVLGMAAEAFIMTNIKLMVALLGAAL